MESSKFIHKTFKNETCLHDLAVDHASIIKAFKKKIKGYYPYKYGYFGYFGITEYTILSHTITIFVCNLEIINWFGLAQNGC